MAEEPNPEERIVFGVGPIEGGGYGLIIGIPQGAWDYMRSKPIDNFTHFDLSKVGVPIKAMLFAGGTRAECLKAIEDHNGRQGIATLRSKQDFSIPGVPKRET